jgi:hypothetical protein
MIRLSVFIVDVLSAAKSGSFTRDIIDRSSHAASLHHQSLHKEGIGSAVGVLAMLSMAPTSCELQLTRLATTWLESK